MEPAGRLRVVCFRAASLGSAAVGALGLRDGHAVRTLPAWAGNLPSMTLLVVGLAGAISPANAIGRGALGLMHLVGGVIASYHLRTALDTEGFRKGCGCLRALGEPSHGHMLLGAAAVLLASLPFLVAQSRRTQVLCCLLCAVGLGIGFFLAPRRLQGVAAPSAPLPTTAPFGPVLDAPRPASPPAPTHNPSAGGGAAEGTPWVLHIGSSAPPCPGDVAPQVFVLSKSGTLLRRELLANDRKVRGGVALVSPTDEQAPFLVSVECEGAVARSSGVKWMKSANAWVGTADEFDAPAGHAIRGEVVDGMGQPVSHVGLLVVGPAAEPSVVAAARRMRRLAGRATTVARTSSRADGTWTVAAWPHESFTVEVLTPGYYALQTLSSREAWTLDSTAPPARVVYGSSSVARVVVGKLYVACARPVSAAFAGTAPTDWMVLGTVLRGTPPTCAGGPMPMDLAAPLKYPDGVWSFGSWVCRDSRVDLEGVAAFDLELRAPGFASTRVSIPWTSAVAVRPVDVQLAPSISGGAARSIRVRLTEAPSALAGAVSTVRWEESRRQPISGRRLAIEPGLEIPLPSVFPEGAYVLRCPLWKGLLRVSVPAGPEDVTVEVPTIPLYGVRVRVALPAGFELAPIGLVGYTPSSPPPPGMPRHDAWWGLNAAAATEDSLSAGRTYWFTGDPQELRVRIGVIGLEIAEHAYPVDDRRHSGLWVSGSLGAPVGCFHVPP